MLLNFLPLKTMCSKTAPSRWGRCNEVESEACDFVSVGATVALQSGSHRQRQESLVQGQQVVTKRNTKETKATKQQKQEKKGVIPSPPRYRVRSGYAATAWAPDARRIMGRQDVALNPTVPCPTRSFKRSRDQIAQWAQALTTSFSNGFSYLVVGHYLFRKIQTNVRELLSFYYLFPIPIYPSSVVALQA